MPKIKKEASGFPVTLNQTKNKFVTKWKDKPIEDAVQAELLNSLGTVVQVRDKGLRDDYRLAAATFLLNKALPDRIEIRKNVLITHASLDQLIKAREMVHKEAIDIKEE